MDYSYSGRKAQLVYESSTCVINVYGILFSVQCRDGSSNLLYCYSCDATRDSFGCSGLRRKQYCILNKQYTKEEYERMMVRIIEHMQNTGEWGQFFPTILTPMPYNRSVAQRYFPLTKEEALAQGFTWFEEEQKEFLGATPAAALLDGLPSSNESLLVKSAASGQPFRIIPQELTKYRTFDAPLPRLTYQERMDERAKILGGIQLYQRTCMKTGKPILTTYSPDAPYIIYDRDEYNKEFQ
jgi:hypothetical protein